MSPKAKTKAPAAPAKKIVAKPAKAGKGGKAEVEMKMEGAQPEVDMEELEEQQEEAAASSRSGGSSAEALAAASGSAEMSASFKNFRHHPDMENFYRFIFENDLRFEALGILNKMMGERQTRKSVKSAKQHAH